MGKPIEEPTDGRRFESFGDEGEDDGDHRSLTNEQLELPWNAFLAEVFVPGLNAASTRRRLAVLRGTVKKLIGQAPADTNLPLIVQQLISTIPRYEDIASRHAVHDLLESLYSQGRKTSGPLDAPVMKGTVKLLERELKGSITGLSPALVYNFASWTALLIRLSFSRSGKEKVDPSSHPESAVWKALIGLHASLLDAVATSDGCKNKLMFSRAEALTIRALGRGGKKGVDAVLKTILQLAAASGKDGQKLCVFLGISLRVAEHKAFLGAFNDSVSDLLNFYNVTMMTSRTAVPTVYLSSLAPFFRQSVTETVFLNDIFPASERLLLRSPEVVIKVLDYTLRYVECDLSSTFRAKFAEMLFTNMRSTNAVVRADAAKMFRTLCERSKDEKELVQIFDVLLKLLSGKAPTVDQRQAYYAAILGLASGPVVARKVIESAPSLVGKESNDVGLELLLQAIARHLDIYVKTETPDAAVLSSAAAFVKAGLNDGKAGTRRAFLTLLSVTLRGDSLKPLCAGPSKDIIQAAKGIVEKVQAAGIALTDPKKETPGLAEAYFATSWLQENDLTKATSDDLSPFFSKVLTGNSVLLNEKFYGKLLVSVEEQLQFVKTIVNVVEHDNWYQQAGASDKASDKEPLAYALVWALVESQHHEVRRTVFSELTRILNTKNVALLSRLIRLVRIGLGTLSLKGGYQARNAGWIEKLSRSSDTVGHKIYAALCAVLPKDSSSGDARWNTAVETGLMDLSVLACHPAVTEIMGNDVWIRLCFRSGTGPQIVSGHVARYIRKWLVDGSGEDVSEGGTSATTPETFRLATYAAITLFTDVATEGVAAEALPWALQAMDNEEVHKLTATDVSIWSTPEGTLFFDPAAKKSKSSSEDRAKTAEEQWERDLKKELLKKGKAASAKPDVKLTKAERDAQQQQLIKETAIRAKVNQLREPLIVGLEVLGAVINGVRRSVGDEAREAFQNWVGRIVRVLLHGVIARELVVVRKNGQPGPGAVLAGQQAIDVYTHLGDISGEQLQSLTAPPVLAMATLRALGVMEGSIGVSSHFCRDALTAFLTSVLDDIKELYSSARPLESAAFSYVFPLLKAIVLREGRIGSLKDREATELAMAASDILLAHCGLASSVAVPRCGMVRCLVELLECYPRVRGAGREGLLTLAFSISTGNDDDEDIARSTADVGEDVSDVVKELLDGLLSPEEAVRESCLMALSHLTIPDEVSLVFDTRVWVARFDEQDTIKEHAEALWTETNGDSSLELEQLDNVVQLVGHEVAAVRRSAGHAMCGVLSHNPNAVSTKLEDLYAIYAKKVALPEPEYDGYGMVIPESLNRPDEWEARAGVASALQACVPIITALEPLTRLYHFLIEGEALGDRNETVQRAMLSAGLSAANASGKVFVRELLDVIDQYLSRPADASEVHDRIREACVILMGTLAQHLDAADPMIPEVIGKLMETLKTPSETVQMAVSECLPGLLKVNKSDSRRLVETLLHQLYKSPKYGERRGAAYGLAGLVKGCGISSLKEYQIMSSLKEAVEDKKRVEKREGAVFAFETLSQTLGRLFEPYVIQILPLLLVCFGDTSREVREATNDACRVIMSKLSAHCVKLVLPSLLNGLEDRNWRTKTGSIDVLSSMAYLAPKQLSVSLPTVVPRICDVLTDSHAKVQESAKQALNQFGNVIKNPEIQALVPVLLSALVDPNGKTGAALSALLDTAFVHYIDAPSLALLVPILQRGLRERSTDIKKRAAQIMGNMATLTDPKDLVPYLPSLMPELKEVLVDPVPDARATAARAFGNMVAKLGEVNFPGLVSELFGTLKSDTSGVDRIGAAQGLSEVLAGLGIERLEGLLPEILANADSPKSYVREGFMSLMIYLPGTFGEKFQPYLGSIIPPVLRGLADESEPVRDSSLKTGKMIIRNYATTAVDLLLPELETGLFDENWRIRQSSVQLMGDLLYRIAGVSGKVELEGGAEDEGLGTEHGRQALITTLGKERFDKVLASLYVARADASAIVRQASLHVWKSIVSNTPRTLKEILPIMMEILIGSLASESVEKQGSAARCLADLVRKLGESILTDLLPILESGLDSDRAEVRQGVCIAMTEVMASAGKTQVVDFVEDCVPLVRKALIDEAPDVRESAAQAFDMLHQHMGRQAIDEILPSLLNKLKAGGKQTDRSSIYALEALKEIMAVRSNVVFPVLIPTLISRPISAFNAQALASLITVAGQALNKRLEAILPALMDALEEGDPATDEIHETIKVLLVNVEGEDGVQQIMSLLTEAVQHGSPARRVVGCQCLKTFCEGNDEDIDEYIADWFEVLISMLREDEGEVGTVKAAWQALDALVKRVDKEEMERFVTTVRRALRDVEENMPEDEMLAGLSMPKGISPILPIFLQGLMYGSPDCREQSALGLGDLVRRTSPEALKPYVTQITGPLIRVIGDRFPSSVKSAILMSLGHLLDRVSPMLKPFLPQLQRTFVKCLSESSGMVRDRAARCLSSLITLQTRLDPLVVELAQALRAAGDSGVRAAVWEALYGLVIGVGGPGRDLNENSRKTIESLITEGISGAGEHEDGARAGASKVFGAYCKYVKTEGSRPAVTSQILEAKGEAEWYRLVGAMLALQCVITEVPAFAQDLEIQEEVASLIAECLRFNKPQVIEEAVTAAARFLAQPSSSGVASEIVLALIDILPIGTASSEARRDAEIVIKNVAKVSHPSLAEHLDKAVTALMANVRDRNQDVKVASERALFHVLQIGKGTEVLQKYLSTLDAAAARNVGDYVRRVLSKLQAEDSDEEDNGRPVVVV
ncbi:translational activator of GCN4 [Thoreauomyces humboldtii]|nr:translational activator of GCN4 [Thoreauomyces humboldtii]